jgi:hypothetical protein
MCRYKVILHICLNLITKPVEPPLDGIESWRVSSPKRDTPYPKEMPTKNPRLILTLKPDLYQCITRYAEAQEVPKARAVTDLLSEMQTSIDRLTEALEEAKKKPEMAFQLLMENLNDAQLQAAQAQVDMFKQKRPKS